MLSKVSLSLTVGLILGLVAVAILRPLQPAGAVLIIFLGLLIGSVLSGIIYFLIGLLRGRHSVPSGK